MSLLISEPPLQVLPSLAKNLKSVDKAIMLQQIFYWQQKSSNVRDGYKWVYNSVKEWHKQFPWLSEKTVQRYLKDLEEKNLLITANYNKASFDRTKWYRVNEEAIDNLGEREGLRVPTKGTASLIDKGTDSPYQYHRIPETTTENSSSSSEKTNSPKEQVDNAFTVYQKHVGFLNGVQTPRFVEYINSLSDEVVKYAIYLMLDQTTRPSFNYLDKILTRYKNLNIHNVDEAKEIEQNRKARQSNDISRPNDSKKNYLF